VNTAGVLCQLQRSHSLNNLAMPAAALIGVTDA
jgi:hypothetical protein